MEEGWPLRVPRTPNQFGRGHLAGPSCPGARSGSMPVAFTGLRCAKNEEENDQEVPDLYHEGANQRAQKRFPDRMRQEKSRGGEYKQCCQHTQDETRQSHDDPPRENALPERFERVPFRFLVRDSWQHTITLPRHRRSNRVFRLTRPLIPNLKIYAVVRNAQAREGHLDGKSAAKMTHRQPVTNAERRKSAAAALKK